ncbi:hypothetical protein [Celeribacter naphthalenivorans]|uniref:hypothetical protein n=1 Tax=Celeribacter naphthalenivorans TaxID=1614694 RepID=UPI001CFB4B8C|nr:hypothetical protein [Celeribacter naphthalenivorans]
MPLQNSKIDGAWDMRVGVADPDAVLFSDYGIDSSKLRKTAEKAVLQSKTVPVYAVDTEGQAAFVILEEISMGIYALGVKK